MVGHTSLRAVTVLADQHTVSSPAKPVEVFPPLELIPRNITLIIGALFQVRTELSSQCLNLVLARMVLSRENYVRVVKHLLETRFWNEFHNISHYNDNQSRILSITCLLSVHEPDSEHTLHEVLCSRTWLWTHSPRDSLCTDLTLNTLSTRFFVHGPDSEHTLHEVLACCRCGYIRKM